MFSAMVMSFAHGSNDVANAMGPFSAVYYIWCAPSHQAYLLWAALIRQIASLTDQTSVLGCAHCLKNFYTDAWSWCVCIPIEQTTCKTGLAAVIDLIVCDTFG